MSVTRELGGSAAADSINTLVVSNYPSCAQFKRKKIDGAKKMSLKILLHFLVIAIEIK